MPDTVKALAIILAAATRGIIVGILGYFTINIFIPLHIHDPIIVLIYLVLTSFILGNIGLICGLFANSFDQMSMVTSYIVTPLSFLSGTFYSVHSLPEFWYKVSNFNPFFYMIDGIRYGIIGYNDGNIITGITYLIILNVILFLFAIFWIKKGYRIKN